jgi:formiminoglutamate deiminase
MTTLFVSEVLTPTGWLADVRITLAGTHIQSVIPDATMRPGDEPHAIAVPGLASLHSHAFQRAMAGLAEVTGATADSFWTWRETMYRFALRMTPDDVEAVAAHLYCELLESGFTRVGEFHYLHHERDGTPYGNVAEMAERIGAAAEASGIGLTLLASFYAHAGFGGLAPADGQRRFICTLDQFSRLLEASQAVVERLPGGNLGVAPHSLRAVAPEELARVVELAGPRPIHIHVAEQTREVEDCLAWSGQRPVEWLLGHAEVDARWCLIHATHVTPTEMRQIAERQAVVGLCPVTEASLGDGTFPARDFLMAGGRYGVGTDSNVQIGVADELRQLEYSQRLALRERNLLAGAPNTSTGRAMIEAAAGGGAQALGQPLTGLCVGARADIVTLRADHPSLAARARDQRIDGWIFSAGSAAIDAVWAGGVKVVEDGRHRSREPVRRRFNAAMARLLA